MILLYIKTIYFEEVLKKTKLIEYRADSPKYKNLIIDPPTKIKLICGRRSLVATIKAINLIDTPTELRLLPFSSTPKCWAIELDPKSY